MNANYSNHIWIQIGCFLKEPETKQNIYESSFMFSTETHCCELDLYSLTKLIHGWRAHFQQQVQSSYKLWIDHVRLIAQFPILLIIWVLETVFFRGNIKQQTDLHFLLFVSN